MFTLGARARLSLGTNVNTPFFQEPTPVQGRDLVLGHESGCLYLGYLVSEHSAILCRCPGTSARASSMNMAIEAATLLTRACFSIVESFSYVCNICGGQKKMFLETFTGNIFCVRAARNTVAAF